MTNEDEILKLTVADLLERYSDYRTNTEKLADVLVDVAKCGKCPTWNICKRDGVPDGTSCFSIIEKWLKEEAEK